MIEFLKGVCKVKRPTSLVVDVQGIGYGVEVPVSTLFQAPAVGQVVELWIYTHVREDALKLFGFATSEEKELFEILLSVNGVGPKLALAILSTLEPMKIQTAVLQNLPEVFEAVPGIGKRMAEKILVEMKSKAKKLMEIRAPHAKLALDFEVEDRTLSDVRSALENLGFKVPAIQTVLRDLENQSLDFPTALRKALARLSGSEPKDVRPTEIF